MNAIVELPKPDRRGPLEIYEDACRAIAQAKSSIEVKEIADKAEAMRVYARQAKNRDLEIRAAEIRIRAERRIGEIIISIKLGSGLNVGGRGQGRPSLVGRPRRTPPGETALPTLASLGVDKKLSSRAQRLAAQPLEDFERSLVAWRRRVEIDGASSRPFKKTSGVADRPKQLSVGGRVLSLVAFGELRSLAKRAAVDAIVLSAIADRYQVSDTTARVGDVLSQEDLGHLFTEASEQVSAQ